MMFIEESGSGESISHIRYMPGDLPMPSLTFSRSDLRETTGEIWAELEVRFEVQMEGNSELFLHGGPNPDIHLRTSDWRLDRT
ncbi:hypothetical protein [Streptomyces sp. NPDC096012]|uniref:hypothetical protein n=1 Tax=Streptomyces sp. NPDC096012 TaxID=3155684 RepID=UPI00336AB6AE